MVEKIKIIAEIGINHNGDIDIAKKLISCAAFAGCDYVKFQKRTPEICVPDSQKEKIRSTPWGEMKYIDYKKKIEFEEKEYNEVYRFCKEVGIECFASVWDIPSIHFMKKYSKIAKIPSALITDIELCKEARNNFDTLIISTGMSTEKEIEICISECSPDVIMHTNSSYPSKYEELSLNYITHLKEKYPNSEIGYSGHEYGLPTTYAAIALGAAWVERHVTLDRSMWGSDQLSSVDPIGTIKLVRGIRAVEVSLGPRDVKERILYPSELLKRKALRGE